MTLVLISELIAVVFLLVEIAMLFVNHQHTPLLVTIRCGINIYQNLLQVSWQKQKHHFPQHQSQQL